MKRGVSGYFAPRVDNDTIRKMEVSAMTDEGRSYLAGVFTGVILGAVLGLLFAPAAGLQTRKQLKDIGDQTTDVVRSRLGEVTSAVSSLRDEVSDLVKDRLPLIDRLQGREAATASDFNGEPNGEPIVE